MEYASNDKVNAALTTGIIGTAGAGLSLLNALRGNGSSGSNGGNGGLLAGLLGNSGGIDINLMGGGVVTQREFELQKQLDSQISRNALLEANIYGDQKSLELYRYIDTQLNDIRSEICNQKVKNQSVEDAFTLARSDIANTRRELSEQIKSEAERRCCGDNAIVNYVNATFYPKMIADITTGATTTVQSLYNPLNNCGCCCGGNKGYSPYNSVND